MRKSKKGKPYVVCYGCGLQMFVRGEPGICRRRRLDGLVESAPAQNSWQRMAELEQRYRMKCPRCGKSFWAGEELRETGWFGELVRYRCPEPGCDAIVEAKPQ